MVVLIEGLQKVVDELAFDMLEEMHEHEPWIKRVVDELMFDMLEDMHGHEPWIQRVMDKLVLDMLEKTYGCEHVDEQLCRSMLDLEFLVPSCKA